MEDGVEVREIDRGTGGDDEEFGFEAAVALAHGRVHRGRRAGVGGFEPDGDTIEGIRGVAFGGSGGDGEAAQVIDGGGDGDLCGVGIDGDFPGKIRRRRRPREEAEGGEGECEDPRHEAPTLFSSAFAAQSYRGVRAFLYIGGARGRIEVGAWEGGAWNVAGAE